MKPQASPVLSPSLSMGWHARASLDEILVGMHLGYDLPFCLKMWGLGGSSLGPSAVHVTKPVWGCSDSYKSLRSRMFLSSHTAVSLVIRAPPSLLPILFSRT